MTKEGVQSVISIERVPASPCDRKGEQIPRAFFYIKDYATEYKHHIIDDSGSMANPWSRTWPITTKFCPGVASGIVHPDIIEFPLRIASSETKI